MVRLLMGIGARERCVQKGDQQDGCVRCLDHHIALRRVRSFQRLEQLDSRSKCLAKKLFQRRGGDAEADVSRVFHDLDHAQNLNSARILQASIRLCLAACWWSTTKSRYAF